MYPNPKSRGFQPRLAARSRQEGAALYVALMILVLLALIGIVGMQVAGLQERMAANYLATNQAFQAAEADVGPPATLGGLPGGIDRLDLVQHRQGQPGSHQRRAARRLRLGR